MKQITNIEIRESAGTENAGVNCSFELLERQGEVALYRFVYASEIGEEPSAVTVQWRIPSVNVFSTWNPEVRFERALRTVCTAGILNRSRISHSAPVQTLIGQDGMNTCTVAVSDAVLPLTINTQIYEEDMDVLCQITFFSLPVKRLNHYEAIVRLDFRTIPYYEAIADVEKWWSRDLGMEAAKVPEAARDALYSTWYSYHHDIAEKAVVERCRKAVKMGMKTVILDAGWNMASETEHRLGDWKVYNPAVNGLVPMVDAIHELGMKFVLWFSIPFLSRDAEIWNRFGEYVLDNKTSGRWYCLDPRYPDVREYLINVYEKAVKEWKLDGLKLDFVNSFELGDSAKQPDDRRDYESLEEAVARLLEDISKRLRSIKEDILLEFRQPYIGPKARMTGNMLRVNDCPNDALFNRVGVMDLRLLSGQSAVHSDMIRWNKEETPQGCARQLIAVLFGVPQISVKIEEQNEEQRAALQFYLDFWNENRDILLDGKLIPLNPEMNFSVVEARGEEKAITVCYGKNYIKSDRRWAEHIIINSCDEEVIILDYSGEEYTAELSVYDCMGNLVREEMCTIRQGLNGFAVPESGMMVVKNRDCR